VRRGEAPAAAPPSHAVQARRTTQAWQLDERAWAQLLAFVGGQAGYARLHAKLGAFFRWRGAHDHDALADVVLDRVARRLTSDPEPPKYAAPFALGVARLVWLEQGRVDARRVDAEGLEAPAPEPDDDSHLQALQRCLGGLTADERKIVLAYYTSTTGRERIDGRQALAERLGVTLNSLRVRAFRVRARLEACVGHQLEAV